MLQSSANFVYGRSAICQQSFNMHSDCAVGLDIYVTDHDIMSSIVLHNYNVK